MENQLFLLFLPDTPDIFLPVLPDIFLPAVFFCLLCFFACFGQEIFKNREAYNNRQF